jgi:hypothetical protein
MHRSICQLRTLALPFLAAVLLLSVLPLAQAQVDFEPHRGTLFIPKDCRFEKDKERCAADNRAMAFCQKERDVEAAHACLRANQSPLVCDEKKSDSAKQRCERINRIYQPCKDKRGDELATCIDQRRTQ